MEEKRLLFQAAIKKENDVTKCYFVEADDTNYYFKYGISKTEKPIENTNNNRLTIVSETKTYYNNFKSAFISCTGSSYGADNENGMTLTYYFFDEYEQGPQIAVSYDDIARLFNDYFHDIIKSALSESDDLFTRDHIFLKNEVIPVFHDNTYADIYDNQCFKKQGLYVTYPKSEAYKMKYLQDEYFDYVRKNEDHDQCASAVANHCDLMIEYLIRKKTHEPILDPISVDGWTADELSSFSCDVDFPWLAIYDLMARIRTQDMFAKDDVKIIMSRQYPYLYNTEKKNSVSYSEETSASKYKKFLQNHTPKTIYDDLKKYIIGQNEMIRSVAEYIYYHVLRQVKINLKPRPLLVAGPSGSGKTEVWRTTKKLYGEYFDVHIVDGSTITQEGWRGNRKISTYLEGLANGDILVVDEFDKLTYPSYGSGGDNVSHHIQSEFLKILEGEYYTQDLEITTDFKTVGIVLVGSFDAIRNAKTEAQSTIGFQNEEKRIMKGKGMITDIELIKFGVMSELVGRISDRCITEELSTDDFLNIIKNKNSRVGILRETLKSLHIDTDSIIDNRKIVELSKAPETSKMGVRWVQSKVEKKLVDLLMEADLRKEFEN